MSDQPLASDSVRSVPKLELPIERFELSCGAVLLVSPRPLSSIAAASVHIRGGPALDPVGREGTAFLAGSLVDQGTARHDEEQLAELLEPEGGEVGGDAAGVSGSIVNERWELLLEALAELVITPAYPSEKVLLHRQRLLDRLLVEEDDPRVRGGLLFRKLVYGDHWLGRAAYGTRASVARIGVRELRAHHKQNWVARRGVIAISGQFDPQDVRRKAERLFARWPAGTPLETTPPRFPPRAVRSGVFHSRRAQVHVYLGHLGVPRSHPDYAALVVMDHVLGTGPGFTNRIARILRDELGLAYSVNASIHSSAGILPGMFTAYIGTSPDKVRTAVEGFRREIARIRSEPVGEEELEVAKSYLVGSFPLGFERAARRAGYMISAEVHRFPDDYLERLLESFAAVTREDVLRVAREHLFPDRCVLAASGPLGKAEVSRLAHAEKR
ncbi:MAG: insulinase family protein [Planctomycetes bacterium]|nr:insulinase family protein [Planctomycetota bacterium]